MRKLFYALIFILLDFTVRLLGGDSGAAFDVLPDLVGYILLLLALRELGSRAALLQVAKLAAVPLALLAGADFAFGLLALAATPLGLAVRWAYAVCEAAAVLLLAAGILQWQAAYGANIGGEALALSLRWTGALLLANDAAGFLYVRFQLLGALRWVVGLAELAAALLALVNCNRAALQYAAYGGAGIAANAEQGPFGPDR